MTVNQVQDPMQRRVLRSLGQCTSRQGVSVDLHSGREWRKAAEELVKAGLAQEVNGKSVLEKTFRISRSGRYRLRRELHGATKKVKR